MQFIRNRAWIGAIVFGVVLIGAGLFMVREARLANDEVTDTLAAERIVSAEDADIPLVAALGASQVVLGAYLGLIARPAAAKAAVAATTTRTVPGGI